MTGHDPILKRIIGDAPPPDFALIHRPHTDRDSVDVLIGTTSRAATTADITLPQDTAVGRHDVLALLPYRQLRERSLACHDDGAPLLVLTIDEQAVTPIDELVATIDEVPIEVVDEGFDVDDSSYAEQVRRIQRDEIGIGAGCNFVVARSYGARVRDWSIPRALGLFRRLITSESGSYWTFLIHTGQRTFLGASPERHLNLDAGTAAMNPISGTFRFPPSGASPQQLVEFLNDPKEANELYMVLDEELKMMSRICPRGGWVRGPALHEMTHLAHTGYLVQGHTDLDPRQVLRETLFAPTVIGGPVANAAAVVARHERRGRSYYGGVAALFGRDRQGQPRLDSTILIRTAEISPAGRLRMAVGATLVRDSDPDREAAETVAKSAGLLTALRTPVPPLHPRPERATLSENATVQAALARHSAPLAPFWLQQPELRRRQPQPHSGRRALIVDAGDAFTHLLRVILDSLGVDVLVTDLPTQQTLSELDAIVLGPGPGDPRNLAEPRIRRLRHFTATALTTGIPILAVCLGHQALCGELGLSLVRKPVPDQGIQRRINLFGRSERVYFYNTFAAVHDDHIAAPGGVGTVEMCRDERTGEIDALRAPGIASVQFHPESVMTPNGSTILDNLLRHILIETSSLPTRR